MNLADNINNAFDVVVKTYENLDKLMRFCDSIANECNYIPSTENYFLRYKSDANYNGWLITSFIKLFQANEDPELENEWREGPLFGMDIYLVGPPVIYLAKYEFEKISDWTHSYFSAAAHWLFAQPIYSEGYNFLRENIDKDNKAYFGSCPSSTLKERYWNLERVVYTKIDLTVINADNVKELIFGEFDNLKSL